MGTVIIVNTEGRVLARSGGFSQFRRIEGENTNNEQINNALCKINKEVSDRVIQNEYKDNAEEKLLFYISQALFLAGNFSQDLVNKEKEGER